ncbi:hypothetical protein [Polaribacter sp. IC073]|uniref:hypothetical protein n=1 Tax=Polaribacter sp. IC073 TaxID=2508540 RepID=UPI0011BD892E|nr:hypothetical protein [Polaribacter sp. IC073]TXD49616.1 hypothetical protein ES045_00055 [Polaribacter sp. IC073]
MSKININFDVSKKDAAMFITSIEYVINNTRNQSAKNRLFKILKEIKFDYWKDDKILLFVSKILQGVTNEPIYINSSLREHLAINPIWIGNTLYIACNNIVKKLMLLNGKNKPFVKITPQQAGKCDVVNDIINLIRTTYDNA